MIVHDEHNRPLTQAEVLTGKRRLTRAIRIGLAQWVREGRTRKVPLKLRAKNAFRSMKQMVM